METKMDYSRLLAGYESVILDFSALFEEHPQDMVGFYISTFRKSGGQMSQLDKKAMYYGINALLKTQKKEGGQPEA